MPKINSDSQIDFLAEKVYAHRWPLNSPIWNESLQEKINLDINKNQSKKKITIDEKKIWINDYEVLKMKKIGITVPLFKKETTMVFEGHFQGFDAHVHITTRSPNYLEIFNKLMKWKTNFFKDLD